MSVSWVHEGLLLLAVWYALLINAVLIGPGTSQLSFRHPPELHHCVPASRLCGCDS